MPDVVVVIGAGSIDKPLLDSISAGKHALLAVDVSSRESVRALLQPPARWGCHRHYPRRRHLTFAGIARGDPLGRSLWNRGRARRSSGISLRPVARALSSLRCAATGYRRYRRAK